MHYKFPVINHIDDVLPHIESCDDFIVADRGTHKIINYNSISSDTFRPPVRNEDGSWDYSLESLIRRECRGLIFDAVTGKIIRRPFHKFFNLNERFETMMEHVSLESAEAEYVKLDGSMISPFVTSDGTFRIGTKMGETDIATTSAAILSIDTARACLNAIEDGYTPIFEFTSLYNRVVIRYDNPELRLTALRHMITGDYMPIETNPFGFTQLVEKYPNTFNNMHDYIDHVTKLVGQEGVVVVWSDGSRIKIKGEHYVAIHKIKDEMLYERNVLPLVLGNQLDDVIAYLDTGDKEQLIKYQDNVTKWIHFVVAKLHEVIYQSLVVDNNDRKTFALTDAPRLGPFSQVVFAEFDSWKTLSKNSIKQLLEPKVKNVMLKACNSNTSLAEFKKRNDGQFPITFNWNE